MYWDEINRHIKNKFENIEKIEVLTNLPNQDKLNSMADSKIYKVQFSSVAVDVVDFKKISMFTDPGIFSAIMSEFTYGVSKIFENFGAKYINIKGDAVFATFSSNKKTHIDNVFTCVCALSTFNNHINKMISKYFDGELMKDNYSLSSNDFSFGIGVHFGWENYISKTGQGSDRELVFMGQTVNFASYLSDISNRDNRKPIHMNQGFMDGMSDEQIKKIEEVGGFETHYSYVVGEKILACDWILSNYENYIENNV